MKENRKRSAEDMLFPDDFDQIAPLKRGRNDGDRRRQDCADEHMVSDSEDENNAFAVDEDALPVAAILFAHIYKSPNIL